MKSQNFDVLEVILKNDLGIPLDEKEEEWLKLVDDEMKSSLFDLVNSQSFLEEIKNIVRNIIAKSSELSKEQQQTIKRKCEERIKKLECEEEKGKTLKIRK